MYMLESLPNINVVPQNVVNSEKFMGSGIERMTDNPALSHKGLYRESSRIQVTCVHRVNSAANPQTEKPYKCKHCASVAIIPLLHSHSFPHLTLTPQHRKPDIHPRLLSQTDFKIKIEQFKMAAVTFEILSFYCTFAIHNSGIV